MRRTSNDPASLSHIERRYYVAPSVRPGDAIRYGDWRDSPEVQTWYDNAHEGPGNYLGKYAARGIPLTVIDYATGSDYSGTLVEISNARSLKRDFPWLVEIHGGHGTYGVGYLGGRENQNPALIEAIDALTQYPLYDEGDHSELELEREWEAWVDDGRKDFARALAKFFDHALDEEHAHEIDDEHASALDQLWHDCTEHLRGGESFLNESGDSIYFPIDDVIQKIARGGAGLDDATYGEDNRSIREKLNALCDATRVKEG